MSYTRFISDIGRLRRVPVVREMTKMLATAKPGTIFMAGGLPNSELFPFQSITFGIDAETQVKVEGSRLQAALQYQPTPGYPGLLETLKRIQTKFHDPPGWARSDIIVTVGSQQGLSNMFELTVNPGDTVIVPDPLYCTVLSVLDPLSVKYLPVPTDKDGMVPDALEERLGSWPLTQKMPKIMYTNPIGANPTGMNISTERKHHLYQIAKKYDLLIFEDDPYYFLHFEKENPMSFLSIDSDERVVRFDSFSKILSSGLRVGFVTGPKELLKYLEMTMGASLLHASALSQVAVDTVLRHWDLEGFVEHTKKVQELYRQRRDAMITAATKHLTGLAEWHVPQGGMFLWMKINGIKDSNEMVMKHGIDQGILLLPGREFMTDRQAPCAYLRAAFSIVSYENMDKGLERLAKLIRDEQHRQSQLSSSS